jgi:formylglycine-generating enzyme required for sulfatase activity
LHGPVLVLVPTPSGSPVAGYCIDATEVTNAQYAEFSGASVPTSGQDAHCSWNFDFTPNAGWPATGKDAYPVVNVDWCDAFAYCKWAGKHLCGSTAGGSNDFAQFANAQQSQWFNACSAAGTLTYPYGNAYDGAKCVGNGYDGTAGYQTGSDKMFAVMTASGCHGPGPYAGVYDLSGNVWEWEDSCNGSTGANDQCRQRGGGFTNDQALACNWDASDNRGYADGILGFRCCAPAS